MLEAPGQALAKREGEAKSQRHDAEDLEAQVRAADAAEKQIIPSWVAALLTFVGTVLLVRNLDEARRANKLAREHMTTDLRAWLMPAGIDYSISDMAQVGDHYVGPAIGFTVALRNSGRTPARDTRLYVGAQCVTVDAPLPTFDPTAAEEGPRVVVAPDHPFKGFRVPVYGEQLAAFQRREMVVYVYALGDYSTIFDDTRRVTEVCYRVKRNGEAIGPQGQITPNLEVELVGDQRIT